MLPCEHTLCYPCTTRVFDDTARCPDCRANLPPEWESYTFHANCFPENATTENLQNEFPALCRCEFPLPQLIRFVSSGVDVNMVDEFGNAPSTLCRNRCSWDSVLYLINFGANLDQASNQIVDLFVESARCGRLDIVSAMYKKDPMLVDALDSKSETALYAASSFGYSKTVMALLSKNADANRLCQHDNEMTSPLLVSCEHGHYKVSKSLLDASANINHIESNGTPLMYAAQNGHHDVVKLLLRHHADVNHVSPELGSTALYLSTLNNHPQIMKLLLNNGANVKDAISCIQKYNNYDEILKNLFEALSLEH